MRLSSKVKQKKSNKKLKIEKKRETAERINMILDINKKSKNILMKNIKDMPYGGNKT